MKKKTMILLFSLPGLFLILCALTFRPISNPQMDECSLLQGKLAKVKSDPKTKDIYLRLEDVDRHLYINRGLEKGLTEDRLKKLIGENVSLYVVNHWTLLDPKAKQGMYRRLNMPKRYYIRSFINWINPLILPYLRKYKGIILFNYNIWITQPTSFGSNFI